MEIVWRAEGAQRILKLTGRLEASDARQLVAAVEQTLPDLEGDLVLDMEGVDFMNSAGLSALIIASRAMAERGSELRLINVHPFVAGVLEVCNLTHLMEGCEGMRVRIWGARGSLPSPIPPGEVRAKIVAALDRAAFGAAREAGGAERFVDALPPQHQATVGGETSCVEVRIGRRLFVFDAGSGARRLGLSLADEASPLVRLFVSHTHWDHIMGFPFFAPAYQQGAVIHVYGGHADIEERFRRQQASKFFPVELDAMQADIHFHVLDVGPSHDIDGVQVRLARMRHPGGSFSFRLDYAGKSLVYATDVEFRDVKAEVAERYADFFADADVLIFDSQYTMEETVAKQDWGHSSPIMGVDLAVECGVKKLLLFHHEPTADDARLWSSLDRARTYLRHMAPDCECEIDLAREELEISL